VFNRVESTDYSRAMTDVYTHEYPLTLSMDVTGQMSSHNARCLPTCHMSVGCIIQ